MNRRLQGVGLGLALIALVGVGGVMTGNGVFAQDATPPPSTSTEPETAERNEFLDAFAAQLGVTDQAAIDAALQATVTQLLDEKVVAGELTQAQADEILARFEAGDVRVGIGGLFRGDHRDGKRDGRGGHDRGDDGKQNDDEDQSTEDSTDDATTPADESTPAAST